MFRELLQKSQKDLRLRAGELAQELLGLRLKMSKRELQKTSEIRRARRERARVKTAISLKNREVNNG